MADTSHSAQKRANRLAREKSPYLLQHQFNPVDWHAWGEEAFAQARAQAKPIFLSIGYSTCHWCHVMERESFEQETAAGFLNSHFVSIKVDREERPDLDKIYMTFVQATRGEGGWPLNVFLTPALKPFYGGTYFPPEPKFGRPSFLQLLEQVRAAWSERRDEVVQSAEHIHEQLKAATRQASDGDQGLDPGLLDRAASLFKREFDPQHGGFGRAPKFPRPSQPLFLLRAAARSGDAEATEMVLHTCDRMAAGGIHDQLGGGFSRYSVDAEWLVPHFEKMLYDNAQLVHLYLDAFLVSGRTRYRDVAARIIEYVLRDMTHPEGGFYSAEDADSEGKEGKFYCWTRAELAALLSPEEFNAAARYFGITEKGNFLDHSDPNPLPGQNVLSIVQPALDPAEAGFLESATRKMFQTRSLRVRPHLDDKILAPWNGMMLSALARAAVVIGDAQLLEAARKNLAFLKARLWDSSAKTLAHRWRDGERDTVQILDGYAQLLQGALSLYQASLEAEVLTFALDLAEAMIDRFYDAGAGGFWQSGGGGSDLILRLKEDYDGAEPSGNSAAILGLLELAAITGRADFKSKAEATLRFFSERFQTLPQAVPHMLIGLDAWAHEPHRVVIAGDPESPSARALARAAHAAFQPSKVVLGTAGPVEQFALLLPAAAEPVAYICTGTFCRPPTSDAAEVTRLVAAHPESQR